MRIDNPSGPHRRQQGAALLVSLIILLVLTILGVTALSSSKLEMQMTANSQEAENVFLAAQTALNAWRAEGNTGLSDHNDPSHLLFRLRNNTVFGDPMTRCTDLHGANDANCSAAFTRDDVISDMKIRRRTVARFGYWNGAKGLRDRCLPDIVCARGSAGSAKSTTSGSGSACFVYEVQGAGWLEHEAGTLPDQPEEGDTRVTIREWNSQQGTKIGC